jgi:hypothetical protein
MSRRLSGGGFLRIRRDLAVMESGAVPLAGRMPARAGGMPALPRQIDKRRGFSGFRGMV